jgi:serine/threonine-protein kinase RsbW
MTDGQAPGLPPSSPQPGAVRPMPSEPGPSLRWRRVFPGQEAELRHVRYWLSELLPDCPARADLITITIELAANAVRHSASGLGGFFAVELSWLGNPATVRVAVADAGGLGGPQQASGAGLAALLGTGPLSISLLPAGTAAPGTGLVGAGFLGTGYLANGPLGTGPPGTDLAGTGPLAAEGLSEHGRGLRLVAALATRAGVCGDHRGRLVWADVRWADDGLDQTVHLDGYTEALRDIQTVLTARYPEARIWFGRATMQWWAMAAGPGAGWLLTAESPLDLAQLLQVYRVTQRPARRRSRGRHGLTGRQPGPATGEPVSLPARGSWRAVAMPPRPSPPARGSWQAVAMAPRQIEPARVLADAPAG